MFKTSLFVIKGEGKSYNEVKFWDDLTFLDKSWWAIRHPSQFIKELLEDYND